jgi:hypothetical protein
MISSWDHRAVVVFDKIVFSSGESIGRWFLPVKAYFAGVMSLQDILEDKWKKTRRATKSVLVIMELPRRPSCDR